MMSDKSTPESFMQCMQMVMPRLMNAMGGSNAQASPTRLSMTGTRRIASVEDLLDTEVSAPKTPVLSAPAATPPRVAPVLALTSGCEETSEAVEDDIDRMLAAAKIPKVKATKECKPKKPKKAVTAKPPPTKPTTLKIDGPWPCTWNACKIYWVTKSSKWRVFPRPGVSVYEKGFTVGKGKTKLQAFNEMLEYLKKPIIPTTSPQYVK